MKKEKTKEKSNSIHSRNDIQCACDNIFDLAFEIDGIIDEFNKYTERTNRIDTSDLYYYEEKLIQYLQICVREYIMLAQKSDRARLTAAKFTNESGYDLSEYANNKEFIDLTENDVVVEETKMERLAAIGQICSNKIDDIVNFLYDSMDDDYWFFDNGEAAKDILLGYVYQENELQRLFPSRLFEKRHVQMIDDIFDERVKKLSHMILIDKLKKEEPKI